MADITKAQISARLLLTRNGLELYNGEFYGSKDDYTRMAQGRAVLGLSQVTPQQIDLGDIGASNPGKKLLLVTSNKILVGINGTTNMIEVSAMISMTAESITSLYVQNESATVEPAVIFAVTD